jgi:hypothetical protein
MSMTPTMAEREAELAALQSAFDEYIASSRELEEELDAELAKMRKSISFTDTKEMDRHIVPRHSQQALPSI